MIALLAIAMAAEPEVQPTVDLYGGTTAPISRTDLTEGDDITVRVQLDQFFAPNTAWMKAPENLATASFLHPVTNGALQLPQTTRYAYVWLPTGSSPHLVSADLDLGEPSREAVVWLSGMSIDRNNRTLAFGDVEFEVEGAKPLYETLRTWQLDEASIAKTEAVTSHVTIRAESTGEVDLTGPIELVQEGQDPHRLDLGRDVQSGPWSGDGEGVLRFGGRELAMTFVGNTDPLYALLDAAENGTIALPGDPEIRLNIEALFTIQTESTTAPTWLGSSLPECGSGNNTECYLPIVTSESVPLTTQIPDASMCKSVDALASWTSAIAPAFTERARGVGVFACPLPAEDEGVALVWDEDGETVFGGQRATSINRIAIERVRVQLLHDGSITASADRVPTGEYVEASLPLTNAGDTQIQIVTTSIDGTSSTQTVVGGLHVGEPPPQFNAVEVHYGLGVRDDARSVMVMAVVSPQFGPKAAANWLDGGFKSWWKWGVGPAAGIRYAAAENPIGLMLGGRISFVPGFSFIGGLDFGTSNITSPWRLREAWTIGIGVDASTLGKAREVVQESN